MTVLLDPTSERSPTIRPRLPRPERLDGLTIGILDIAKARGIPTVGVATTEFIEGAAAQAKSLGIDPALVFIPHPVQDRTDDELKKLADDHLEPILAMLVKGREAGPA